MIALAAVGLAAAVWWPLLTSCDRTLDKNEKGLPSRDFTTTFLSAITCAEGDLLKTHNTILYTTVTYHYVIVNTVTIS